MIGPVGTLCCMIVDTLDREIGKVGRYPAVTPLARMRDLSPTLGRSRSPLWSMVVALHPTSPVLARDRAASVHSPLHTNSLKKKFY